MPKSSKERYVAALSLNREFQKELEPDYGYFTYYSACFAEYSLNPDFNKEYFKREKDQSLKIIGEKWQKMNETVRESYENQFILQPILVKKFMGVNFETMSELVPNFTDIQI